MGGLTSLLLLYKSYINKTSNFIKKLLVEILTITGKKYLTKVIYCLINQSIIVIKNRIDSEQILCFLLCLFHQVLSKIKEENHESTNNQLN